MMNKLSKFFLTVGIVATLAACGNEKSATQSERPEELSIVQMPNENNPNTASVHTELRDHLSEELGIEVKEYDGGSYAVGIEALSSGNLDVMLVTPMSYYQAKQKAGAEIVASPQSEGYEYYTAFITQGDNKDINDMEDIKGTNFAFVNPSSSSGYLYPKGTLVQEFDLDPDRVEQSGYFFENVTYSESHPNSVMGVVMGDYEVAAVAIGQLTRMIESDTIQEDDVKIIGRTLDIPDQSYVVRGDLQDEFKEELRDAFLSFENEEYFETIYGEPSTKFVEVGQDFYDDTIEMLDSINALGEEE